MPERLEDVEHIHAGSLFDVFRARLGAGVVCVKRTASKDRGPRNSALAAIWTHRNETNIFHTREIGWSAPDEAGPGACHYEALLRAEHIVIERVAAHWNHPALAAAAVLGVASLLITLDGLLNAFEIQAFTAGAGGVAQLLGTKEGQRLWQA